MRCSKTWSTGALALLATCLTAATAAAAPSDPKARVAEFLPHPEVLSQGARAWLQRPGGGPTARAFATPALGTNVDANDPQLDLAAGQSETAIAAQTGSAGRQLVLAGWNDASGILFTDSTDRRASGTGIGLSADGARSFTDLIGLPNNNIDQQWQGDPAIASLGDGRHFAIASLYFPSLRACTDGLPAELTIAVSIARVDATGRSASFSRPIPVAEASDACDENAPTIDLLDKDWVAYDPQSRTLALSYTRFVLSQDAQSLGQVEVARAKVPLNPLQLRSGDFSAPEVVWPDEPPCPPGTPSSESTRCGAVNTGAYVTLAAGGDTYVAWERNIDSLFSASGDPYVYIHAAVLPPGVHRPTVGGPGAPFVVTTGQANSNAAGGVKSLGNVAIAGYNRGLGNDFPRAVYDRKAQQLLVAWNDASSHPLGDIWMRAMTPRLAGRATIQRVNSDNTFALHFLPAISVRTDGTICTSWYDRRLFSPDSTRTDYFAECRPSAGSSQPDFRITTASTDWNATSSLIVPNFGDYTDTTASGPVTYFTWSDGRLGVPQPFVDRRPR
jgi:hypothetical protein